MPVAGSVTTPGRQRARRNGGRRKDIGAKVTEKDDARRASCWLGSPRDESTRETWKFVPSTFPRLLFRSFLPVIRIPVSLSYIVTVLSFVFSASTSGFPLPRDRRKPLPSFHDDDIKRVLMSVQLWRLASIKAHRCSARYSSFPSPRFPRFKRLANHERNFYQR